jgi:hypothetical protein
MAKVAEMAKEQNHERKTAVSLRLDREDGAF